MKYKVNEYGEAKAEGRSFIVEADSREEALEKAPYPKWGATVQEICVYCNRRVCTKYVDACDYCANIAAQMGCDVSEIPQEVTDGNSSQA